MSHDEAGGNGPDFKFISDTACYNLPALFGDPDEPVAIGRISRSRPQPAFVSASNIDLLPKPLPKRSPARTARRYYSLAFWAVMPPTSTSSIGKIVGLRAEFQMIGSDAPRVVTAMPDDHSLRDRPIDEFPRNTMRPALGSVGADTAVSELIRPRRPEPAAVSLDDLLPEANLKRDLGGGHLPILSHHQESCKSRSVCHSSHVTPVRHVTDAVAVTRTRRKAAICTSASRPSGNW